MSLRVSIRPELFEWAIARSGRDMRELTQRFPYLPDWISGDEAPTLNQLEELASVTHAPLGAFFLETPPSETIPIPDLRTVGDAGVRRPSGDLLDTIYACQRRQGWYHDHLRLEGESGPAFVGSAKVGDDPRATAATIRRVLGLDTLDPSTFRTWEDAFRDLIERIEDAGVLVMVNGVVGHDTHRRLDSEEFRGFALVDPLAPLIFVNGADAKLAQTFTLAHELAHVWLGESGVSDVAPDRVQALATERWCNAVAAEVLVPEEALRAEFRAAATVESETSRLAQHFKVSRLVMLRRFLEAGLLDATRMWALYRSYAASSAKPPSAGGNFYAVAARRVSPRFARALYASTLEGHTGFMAAFRLLDIKNTQTFHGLGEQLGVRHG
ncbi:MAG: ImmA/IrrE family metallo-endopeptidase [Myxococcales bacterium]|nr:ImmA/IrrE family metallo-endopeptidase [Myxococcales bacterium]